MACGGKQRVEQGNGGTGQQVIGGLWAGGEDWGVGSHDNIYYLLLTICYLLLTTDYLVFAIVYWLFGVEYRY